MSFINSLLSRFQQKGETLTLDDRRGWGHHGVSVAGVFVNDQTPLEMTASWQAIRIISETLGTLPLHLYRRTENGRERATDHPLYWVIKQRPNKYMTSISFRESIGVSLTCSGQFYAKKQMLGGEVYSVMPLPKHCCRPFEQDGDIFYRVTERDGTTGTYGEDEILSIKGFGGVAELEGYAPHQMQKRAIGVSLAAEQFAANFFKNGSHLGGVIESDVSIVKQDQYDLVMKRHAESHTGVANAFKWKLLVPGMKAVPNTVNNRDSELSSTRKNQINEIARIYNVPPTMLMEMDRATWSNIEHHNRYLTQFTLQPYMVRIEEAFNNSLLSREESKEYYFEFDTRGLLRGDSAARADYYLKMRQMSVMTQNEVRRAENMSDMVGGDDLMAPLNTNPVSSTSTSEKQGDSDGA